MIEGTEVKIFLDKNGLIISPKAGRNRKVIGILGGMGPEATADLYMKIINFCQKKYGARYDCDYPQIIVNSIPAPQMIDSLNKTREVELCNMLMEGVKKLEASGVDFIVIACNTVHYFIEKLRKATSIPILSIIEETTKKAKENKIKKIGLLATTTTAKQKVYERELVKFGITSILPDEKSQAEVTEIIRKIIAGDKSRKDKNKLENVIEGLLKRGARGVILGCTDLPIILKKDNFDIDILDSTEVLAEAAADKAYGE